MDPIFNPRTVAVVGANNVKGSVPHDLLYNMLKADFRGGIYPVSPRDRFIAGLKTYKYVIDIEDEIDLAVIVFPGSVCHLALEQCGQRGIPAAVIISAGFREIGPKGREREEQLRSIAKKYGIRFIGPNCLGVINTDPDVGLNASFAREMPDEGSIAFLSQSGALCTAVLDYAAARQIGFSKFVSFGNKADISEIDLLYYLKDDPKTKVILLYLEEITDGRALMEAARNILKESGKPILALKAGRTEEGALAAVSHTGSLASSDAIIDAAFRQCGIIRCENIEDMFQKALALNHQPLPKNNRVAVITNAGGPGVLTTDAAIQNQLTMAEFETKTTDVLRKHLPKTANIKNPVDVIGDARADRYEKAVSAIMADANVDGVMVILTPQSMTDIQQIAETLIQLEQKFDKPLYTSFMGEKDVSVGVKLLETNRIPHYRLPESMCRAFSAAWTFQTSMNGYNDKKTSAPAINRNAVEHLLKPVDSKVHPWLTEDVCLQIAEHYGLPVVKHGKACSLQEALNLAGQIGYPVALKVIADQVIHKFDLGGVALNIENEDDLKAGYKDVFDRVSRHISEEKIKGILVSRMIPAGEELILGVKRDPAFGPVVMFGAGGIFAEVYNDVTFAVAPIGKKDAESMISATRVNKRLDAWRGQQASDKAAVQETLIKLSYLAADSPHVEELDINPLIVLQEGKGAWIADIKIRLSEKEDGT